MKEKAAFKYTYSLLLLQTLITVGEPSTSQSHL